MDMTAAPAPSPAEQAVIDRFGIFDEDRAAACTCLMPVEAMGYQHALRCPASPRPVR